ncbi:GtrA family protein [Actibacterium pelagium]|uniref:GtrA/DPMS transmembrane domain-containing protein n=1 Tax=Actibacterium pelagium TaxID=2029103 RepID=A0A917AN69_9RHOB|nr:GtrA family protein [Actibacterium pelagium]GGE61888.1 hypothetical protein GCM10011517_31920 [Actibacterium pelagium]
MLRWFVNTVHDQPELVRIAIVAVMGTALSWVTYEIVYFLNPFSPRAPLSWGMAFTIGIFRQHHLHRTLSFPKARLSYLSSLQREIAASVLILLIGVILNYSLTQVFDLQHRVAWGLCLVTVSGIEYALMKLFVFSGRREGDSL